MTIKINELMIRSGVQFGTSGVRGLVKDMSDEVCFSYVTAFLKYLNDKQQKAFDMLKEKKLLKELLIFRFVI